MSGMHAAVLVGAAIALTGALIALVFLPARERETERAPALAMVPA